MERKHQDILNITKALLFQSLLPNFFWNFATAHTVFLLNRLPSVALDFCTPYEKLYCKLPNLSFLKVFGCQCYASTLTSHRKKLDPRARTCVYLGQKSGVKGYVLYEIHTREVFISRNVVFQETVFPFLGTSNHNSEEPILPVPSSDSVAGTNDDDYSFSAVQPTHMNPCPATSLNPLPKPASPSRDSNNNHHTNPPPLPNIPSLRRSACNHHPPSYLQDFHCNLATSTTV